MASRPTLTACERNIMGKMPCKALPMSKKCTKTLKKELRKCPQFKGIRSNLDQQRAINKRIKQLRPVRVEMMKKVGAKTYRQNRAKMRTATERKQQAFALQAPKTSTDAAANYLYQQALEAKNKAENPSERDSGKQERIDARDAQNKADRERERYDALLARAGQVTSGNTFIFPPTGQKPPKKRRKRARPSAPEPYQYEPGSPPPPPGSPPPQFFFTPPAETPPRGLRAVRARTDEGTAVLPLGGLAPAPVNQTVAQARRQSTNGISGGGGVSSIAQMTPDQRGGARAAVRRQTLGGLGSATPFLGGQPDRGGTLATATLSAGRPRGTNRQPPPGPPPERRRPRTAPPAARTSVPVAQTPLAIDPTARALEAGRERSRRTGEVSYTETPTGITYHSY